jgi:hypothetical protein
VFLKKKKSLGSFSSFSLSPFAIDRQAMAPFTPRLLTFLPNASSRQYSPVMSSNFARRAFDEEAPRCWDGVGMML